MIKVRAEILDLNTLEVVRQQHTFATEAELLNFKLDFESIVLLDDNLHTEVKVNRNHKDEGLTVVSLFDGMSCGQIALERLGIPIKRYLASEIDKYAISVTQDNYPFTEHIGDVTKVNGHTLPFTDLLIGGSPCQGFSFAGKQLNFDDPRSKLFFEFVRILRELRQRNPDIYFLMENVKMKKEYQAIISEHLGVEPVEINSNLVSAQNRKRLFWTNIPFFGQPEDKGILLKDITHETLDTLIDVDSFNINPSGKGMNGLVYGITKGKSNTLTTNKGEGQKIAIGEHEYPVVIEAPPESDAHIKWLKTNAEDRLKKKYLALDPDKAITLTARQYANWNGNFVFEELEKYLVPFDKTFKILDREVKRGKVGFFRKDSQANRVYFIHDKAVTLCGDAGGAAKMSQYLFGHTLKNFQGDRVHHGYKKSPLFSGQRGQDCWVFCFTGLHNS